MRIVFALLLGMMLVTGCVPVMSLHPLFEESDLVFKESLLGTWSEDVNDANNAWQFSRLEDPNGYMFLEDLPDNVEAFYLVSLYDDGKRMGLLLGALGKLDNQLYLNLYPTQLPSGANDEDDLPLLFNAFFVMPVHTFMKVELSEDRLVLALTDDEAMRRLIKENPKAIAHTVVKDNQPLLTANTKELQAFVKKFSEHEDLFEDDIELGRVKSAK